MKPGLKISRIIVVLSLALTLIRPMAHAQFDSGSNGSDGALDFSNAAPDTTVIFDPATFNPALDPDGDNVYHFTTITIPANVTVKLTAGILGTPPIIWLASGAVQVDGAIDLNGEDGHAWDAPVRPAIAGAGGYGGGVGGTIDSAAQSGSGPGGGRAIAGRHGGSAGHAAVGAGGVAAGAAYGNPFLLPLLGGSGGAGGWLAVNNNGAGGGAGGGALLIASSVSITLNGAISANGGDGGDGNGGINLAGGSGSGGGIRLMTPTIRGAGTLSAQGGTAVRGDAGARGRIRIETFQNAFTGEINGSPSFSSSPGIVFLPADAPNVRVVSIAGVNVPSNPGGTATTPDTTINEPAEVTIGLEAQFIPLGTVITLIISSDGTQQTVNSTPLEGTLDQSAATATATFPHGFSRIFVKASWTP